MPKTYADSVRNNIPPPHIVAVVRAIAQKRKIRLVKVIGMVGEGMVELSEKQLVEKANMVLVLMAEGEERRPIEVRFVGANKERGSGGVTYELNSEEVAEWLRGRTTMLDFLMKMGSMADFKEQTYEVVIDWISTLLEIDQHNGWRAIKQVNGLESNMIKGMHWIKPTHLRTPGKRTVITIFKMATWEDENLIIERGLFIEGKKVWGRKQIQEPRRCLKCQCFGEHKAIEC